jgi:hypothetical protein
MKKLITIVAFVTAIAASPAFAMYDPGPTTGSASNQAEHAIGRYSSQSQASTQQPTAQESKQAREGDFYAPIN